jgi:hypothetical protein
MLYREEIRLPYAIWLAWAFGLLTAGFACVLLYWLFVGPIWNDPLPGWFWGLMAGLCLALAALFGNFRRLTVEIGEREITVAFGTMRRAVPWERVAGVRRAGRSSGLYGGAGWRVRRLRSGWTMAFVDFGSPRVVLELRGGKLRELVFSTRDPAEVIRTIRGRLTGQGTDGHVG